MPGQVRHRESVRRHRVRAQAEEPERHREPVRAAERPVGARAPGRRAARRALRVPRAEEPERERRAAQVRPAQAPSAARLRALPAEVPVRGPQVVERAQALQARVRESAQALPAARRELQAEAQVQVLPAEAQAPEQRAASHRRRLQAAEPPPGSWVCLPWWSSFFLDPSSDMSIQHPQSVVDPTETATNKGHFLTFCRVYATPYPIAMKRRRALCHHGF